MATAGVAGVTSCVPNDCLYGRLDTETSGGMAPASPQTPPPSFDRQRIGNAIVLDDVFIPGRVEELDCMSEEDQCVWERRVQYMEVEV